jgi:Trypsin-like peptidase domain
METTKGLIATQIDKRVAGYLGRVLDDVNEPVGTCFQIADRIGVTAWHVLVDTDAADVQKILRIDPLRGGAAIEARVERIDTMHDLAVVRLSRSLPESATRLAATDQVQLGAPLSVTGVAMVDDSYTYRHIDAPGQWAGSSTRDDQIELGRMTSSAVVKGMSGAPVLDSEGSVTGVVSGRYNSADGWLRDSVWVARTENLAELLEGILDVQLTAPALLHEFHGSKVNPRFLASLLRSEKMIETLPPMLAPGAIGEVMISDGGKGRVDVARLFVDWAVDDEYGEVNEGINCYFEVFDSPASAKFRATSRLAGLTTQYADFGGSQGDADNFCINGNREWICGAHTGYIYVEVNSWPDSNAVLAVTSSTLAALIRHAERITSLAAN